MLLTTKSLSANRLFRILLSCCIPFEERSGRTLVCGLKRSVKVGGPIPLVSLYVWTQQFTLLCISSHSISESSCSSCVSERLSRLSTARSYISEPEPEPHIHTYKPSRAVQLSPSRILRGQLQQQGFVCLRPSLGHEIHISFRMALLNEVTIGTVVSTQSYILACWIITC